MFDLEGGSCRARILGLIPWVARSAYSERFDVTSEPGDRPTDKARIDTAAQQRSNRDVSVQTLLDSIEKESFSLLYCFIERRR